MPRHPSPLVPLALAAVFATATSQPEVLAQLSSDATRIGDDDIPGAFMLAPAVELLYDNGIANFTTSIASQDSEEFFARTADDFVLDGESLGCSTGRFDIAEVLVMMVQEDSTPQAFGVEFYEDDGAGRPRPANAAVPIASFPETSQIDLGRFGLTTTLFQVGFETPGLSLRADIPYWISSFGTDVTTNGDAFYNFFAVSNGAEGTEDNGVVIAPVAEVDIWTPIDDVLGPPARAFSFAIAGSCGAAQTLEVPSLGVGGMLVLTSLLAGLSLAVINRGRST